MSVLFRYQLSRIMVTSAKPQLCFFLSTKWFWQWTRQLQCLWDAQQQGCSFGLLVATIQTKTSHSVFQAWRTFTWWLSAVMYFMIQNTTQDPLYSSHSTQQNVNKRNGLELFTGKLWTAVHAASMHRSPNTTPHACCCSAHLFSSHQRIYAETGSWCY